MRLQVNGSEPVCTLESSVESEKLSARGPAQRFCWHHMVSAVAKRHQTQALIFFFRGSRSSALGGTRTRFGVHLPGDADPGHMSRNTPLPSSSSASAQLISLNSTPPQPAGTPHCAPGPTLFPRAPQSHVGDEKDHGGRPEAGLARGWPWSWPADPSLC